jgi:hypothetical protein
MVKIICENQNTIQPKVDVDSEPKRAHPITNIGQQQENQWLRGPSKNQPSGGDEVPTRLASEGMGRSYDELCETTLTGASTLY